MERKNVWNKYTSSDEIMNFAEGYKDFISKGKTERLAAKIVVDELITLGYKDIKDVKSLKAGDKIYAINRNKNVLAFVIGKEDITKGMRILGAHIDSPRLDFKEKPLYESHGFVYGNTHYYGGIKKYQWVTIPLALHGVVCLKNGTTVKVEIGEKEDDPVLGISDLLIHLAADQLQQTLAKGIEGEKLDVTLGSIPLKDEQKDAVKANVLRLLKDKYGIVEEDFISSEIEVVPAGKARDYGLDRSMVAGYGHDDRCCAYSSFKAFIEVNEPVFTTCLALVDKEEIGSVGATGAQSLFFENTVLRIVKLLGHNDSFLSTRTALENSKMLSSDVTAAYDPLFAQVYDLTNVAFFGEGIVFNKYTGSRGKSGSNDANPEYYAWLRNAMDKEGVIWQSSELGKVDQGGGGTIAYILGNYNMDVIDAGIPVLNMHAPLEVISKADLYEAYVGYRTFLLA